MIRPTLLILGLFLAGSERVSDPETATRSFFEHLAQKQTAAAFEDATFFFRHQQTLREFQASVHELGLEGCKFVRAETPTVGAVLAKQTVELRTRSGAPLTLVATLTRERGAWRIFSIKSPMNLETGISENYFTHIGKGQQLTSVQENPLPDEATAKAMAKETMLQFHDAIQQKSFEDFYDGVARAWQRQLTLGMLTRTFQGFIDKRTNFIAIKDLDAVLKDRPRIDSDGLLNVSGSYMTQPHRIDFDIKYFYEMPNWRPFGVTVRLIE